MFYMPFQNYLGTIFAANFIENGEMVYGFIVTVVVVQNTQISCNMAKFKDPCGIFGNVSYVTGYSHI